MITLDQPTQRAFSTAVAFIALTFIFVGLRLFLRARAKQLSFLSDGLCLASFVLFCAFVGLMLECMCHLQATLLPCCIASWIIGAD
jgi:hypothetical protein